MENSVQIFKSDRFGEVRVAELNGELRFVAKDVAERLGYKWQPNIVGHVPDEWKGVNPINTPGGAQEVITLSEQGLYFFLARSDKPAALPFQKWIAGEVIPSIRRHGIYATAETVEKMLADPDTAIKLLEAIKEERRLRLEAERRQAEQQRVLERQAPKVRFADAVAASNRSVSVADFAKILRQNGVKTGQNRLFEWMRNSGYLCTRRGYRNHPTQKAMEEGLFEVEEKTITRPSHPPMVSITTRITGKGQIFFTGKLVVHPELF